jgi:hypothetical protein
LFVVKRIDPGYSELATPVLEIRKRIILVAHVEEIEEDADGQL